MTLKEIFIDALRQVGVPATAEEIHKAHTAAGGRYTRQAFVTVAWNLTQEKQIVRTNTRPPYIYTLPHNALERHAKSLRDERTPFKKRATSQ